MTQMRDSAGRTRNGPRPARVVKSSPGLAKCDADISRWLRRGLDYPAPWPPFLAVARLRPRTVILLRRRLP